MPTALDMIGKNSALQEHWIRRLIALIIDTILIAVVTTIFGALLLIFRFDLLFWPFLFGIIWLLYSFLFEGGMGGTIGKKIVSLRVVGVTGPMDASKALIRNLSKVHPVLLFIDWIVGFATTGDPRQRFLDRIAGTTVTRTDQQAYMEEQFRQMQYVPPHPQAPPPEAWSQPSQQQPRQPPQQAQPAQPVDYTWGTQPKTTWPRHEWDEQGQLKPQPRFCTSCGGQLIPRGDGRLTCVRCGLVY